MAYRENLERLTWNGRDNSLPNWALARKRMSGWVQKRGRLGGLRLGLQAVSGEGAMGILEEF